MWMVHKIETDHTKMFQKYTATLEVRVINVRWPGLVVATKNFRNLRKAEKWLVDQEDAFLDRRNLEPSVVHWVIQERNWNEEVAR